MVSVVENIDCMELLSTMADESVDLLCTDPPYGYSFMGKDWDKAVPSVEIWKECLRVMKSGSFAFIMSAPRQDVLSHMIVNLDKAGFETGFTSIYYTYASGFPKALNLHKKLTKSEAEGKLKMQELWRTIIYSSESVEQNNNRSHLPKMLEDLEQGTQHEIFSYTGSEIQSSKISKRQQQSFMERWSNVSEAERKLCECSICKMPCGIYIDGKEGWLCYGTSVGNGKFYWESIDKDGVRSSYQSQSAGQSNTELEIICEQCRTQKVGTLKSTYGGFQPKPAVEIVIVVMKPLAKKSFTDQALDNSKGVTWLDDCRVPFEETQNAATNPKFRTQNGYKLPPKDQPSKGSTNFISGGGESSLEGRFPANLIVSDDVLNDGKVYAGQQGATTGDEPSTEIRGNTYGDYTGQSKPSQPRNDEGSFSRYYDLDKWWEERIKSLPENVRKVFPFLITPKAAKSEKDLGCNSIIPQKRSEANKMMGDAGAMKTGSGNDRTTEFKNHHPTVKPIKLMSYLITLGSREKDTIFDPFMGSGTTGIAANLTNRNFIGSELNEEYFKIAESRIKIVAIQTKIDF